MAIYRLDTPQKIVARLGPPALGIALFAYFMPSAFAEHWGKAAFVVLAFLIFAPVVYVWTYRTLPTPPPLTAVLSPFYDPAVRRKAKAEERAKEQAIVRLRSESRAYQEQMVRLDLTSQESQEQFKQLSAKKLELDRRADELDKLPKLRLGYMPD